MKVFGFGMFAFKWQSPLVAIRITTLCLSEAKRRKQCDIDMEPTNLQEVWKLGSKTKHCCSDFFFSVNMNDSGYVTDFLRHWPGCFLGRIHQCRDILCTRLDFLYKACFSSKIFECMLPYSKSVEVLCVYIREKIIREKQRLLHAPVIHVSPVSRS